MVWFSAEQATDITVIQQLITAWAHDLDQHEGLNMGPLLSEDTVYMGRGVPRHGRAAAEQFYTERAKEFGGNTPTMRHVISNLLVQFSDADHARVDFLLTYFFSLAKPPVTDFNGPLALADVWMDVRRDSDGHWRIATFDSVQNFVRSN